MKAGFSSNLRALDRLASTTMDGRSLDIQGVPESPSRDGAA
jgi:hypothetical protein